MKRAEKRRLATELIQAGLGSTEICNRLRLSRATVCKIARELGVTMPKPGLQRETPLETLTCRTCGKEFERPASTHNLNLAKARAAGRAAPLTYCSPECHYATKRWPDDDVACFIEHYGKESSRRLGRRFGVTPGAVRWRAKALGIWCR